MKITSLYKQNCEDEFCINLLLKLSNSTYDEFCINLLLKLSNSTHEMFIS